MTQNLKYPSLLTGVAMNEAWTCYILVDTQLRYIAGNLMTNQWNKNKHVNNARSSSSWMPLPIAYPAFEYVAGKSAGAVVVKNHFCLTTAREEFK